MQKLRTIESLAQQLLRQHLPDWHFAFNRQRRTLGLCRYQEQRIELSRHHAELGSLAQAETTLLHEIAHALAGPRTGHGPQWRRIMRELGQVPKVTARPDYEVNDYNWALVRRDGNHLHWISGRYRRPQKSAHWALRGRPEPLGTVYFCRFEDYQAFAAGALPLAKLNLEQ
ncbi:MAG: SprT-like domain-containing protein [Natronospirillum sp.]